jgi:hypothetical protein
MPVGRRAVSWLTGAVLALLGTAVVLALPTTNPDPAAADEHVLVSANTARALVVVFVVVSSSVGGRAAGAVHSRVERSGSWPAAAGCVVAGVIVGVATFFVLALLVALLLFIRFGGPGIS